MHCAQGSIGNISLNLNKYMDTYKYCPYFYREGNSNLESTWLSQRSGDMIDGKMPTDTVRGCAVSLMAKTMWTYRDNYLKQALPDGDLSFLSPEPPWRHAAAADSICVVWRFYEAQEACLCQRGSEEFLYRFGTPSTYTFWWFWPSACLLSWCKNGYEAMQTHSWT